MYPMRQISCVTKVNIQEHTCTSITITPKPCADPEGGGVGGGLDIPPTTTKTGCVSNTGPDPLKITRYQASIQCWAIIGIDYGRLIVCCMGKGM